MRIKKLQIGGVAPFKTYTPNVAAIDEQALAQQAASTKQDDKKEDEGMLSKEMINVIMKDGIPSDVENFMTQLSQFSQGISGGMSTMDSSQLYSMILPQIAKIKYNKEDLNATKNNLSSNGGLNEAALTTNGGVVVRGDKGDTSIISIEEYSKDPSKYSLLTNNDLLKMRAYDKNLAFNNNITSILKNGQGTENITKELQNVINQMKTQKDQREGFIPAEQVEALKGIDAIKGVVTVNTTSESSRKYKEYAKEYLYNMLPQNSKNLLKVKAAERGVQPKDIIEMLIIPSTLENTSEKVDLSSAKSGSSSGSGSGGSSATRDITWLDAYVGNSMGTGAKGKMKQHEINLGGSYSMMAPAIELNGIIDAKTREMLPKNSSIGTIVRQGFATIGDSSNIYFGDEKVSPDKLDNIVATGENMSKAYLPIDKEHQRRTGELKPDFTLSKQVKAAEDKIRASGAKSEDEKYLIYREFGVADYLTNDPVANKDLFAPFAIIPSWAQGEGVVKNRNPLFLTEVGDDDEDIRRLLNEGKLGRKMQKGDKDYLKGWSNIFSDTDIYQGMVFIHTPDDVQSAAVAGSYLTVPKTYGDYGNVMTNQIQAEEQNKIRNLQTNSNILY